MPPQARDLEGDVLAGGPLPELPPLLARVVTAVARGLPAGGHRKRGGLITQTGAKHQGEAGLTSITKGQL